MKVFTGFLAFFYFGSNVVLGSTAELNFWTERQKTLNQPAPFLAKHIPLLESLSQAKGAIVKINVPKQQTRDQLVIHILDIHQNLEAQRNIGDAITKLVTHHHIDLIGLEGAFEPIDLARFRAFPHQDVIHKVADYLLRENRISGPIHAVLR